MADQKQTSGKMRMGQSAVWLESDASFALVLVVIACAITGNGRRSAYQSHAFYSGSLSLIGRMREARLNQSRMERRKPGRSCSPSRLSASVSVTTASGEW